MDEYERQLRRNSISRARKSFNYLARKYMEVHSHHKSWIEGLFSDLENMVEEVKLGE
jgi:hypothetical protein